MCDHTVRVDVANPGVRESVTELRVELSGKSPSNEQRRNGRSRLVPLLRAFRRVDTDPEIRLRETQVLELCVESPTIVGGPPISGRKRAQLMLCGVRGVDLVARWARDGVALNLSHTQRGDATNESGLRGR